MARDLVVRGGLGLDAIGALRADIEKVTRRLSVVHAARLQCKQGCSSCCVDDLTIFEVEAAPVRARHAELLATGEPHAAGACAFLDPAGACRIYADRPYVCRTQGLPLRWTEPTSDGVVELRDICPLNEVGAPIAELPAEACWTLGPVEEKLAVLQVAADPRGQRIYLRALFKALPRAS